jgi:hypothetical protein
MAGFEFESASEPEIGMAGFEFGSGSEPGVEMAGFGRASSKYLSQARDAAGTSCVTAARLHRKKNSVQQQIRLHSVATTSNWRRFHQRCSVCATDFFKVCQRVQVQDQNPVQDDRISPSGVGSANLDHWIRAMPTAQG